MYHCFCKGFVIVGEDNTGKLDLGVFIASIVPDGPADKDGRIRPGKILTIFPLLCKKKQIKDAESLFLFCLGGRLISLNKISLEGVTFNIAAAILQNSPDEVELIVSQPKRKSSYCTM